jgi:hypothetical protein
MYDRNANRLIPFDENYTGVEYPLVLVHPVVQPVPSSRLPNNPQPKTWQRCMTGGVAGVDVGVEVAVVAVANCTSPEAHKTERPYEEGNPP